MIKIITLQSILSTILHTIVQKTDWSKFLTDTWQLLADRSFFSFSTAALLSKGIDNKLTFNDYVSNVCKAAHYHYQVSNVCKAAHYHVRVLHHVRKYVSHEIATSIAQ